MRKSAYLCLCLFRSEELVKTFLDDPDADVLLSVGPDMRRIQYCFSLLKVMHLYCYISVLVVLNLSSHPESHSRVAGLKSWSSKIGEHTICHFWSQKSENNF